MNHLGISICHQEKVSSNKWKNLTILPFPNFKREIITKIAYFETSFVLLQALRVPLYPISKIGH